MCTYYNIKADGNDASCVIATAMTATMITTKNAVLNRMIRLHDDHIDVPILDWHEAILVHCI